MPHPVDLHVGRQLKVQRVIMGLSQEALAKAVGITFQQVQKYERGINRMSASRLYDFARVLNVPVSFFFEGLDQNLAATGEEGGETYSYGETSGVGERIAEEFAHEDVLTRETLELMRCYHRIKNVAVKRRFVDLLRAVSEDKAILEEAV